jgi:hypothetical protein
VGCPPEALIGLFGWLGGGLGWVGGFGGFRDNRAFKDNRDKLLRVVPKGLIGPRGPRGAERLCQAKDLKL